MPSFVPRHPVWGFPPAAPDLRSISSTCSNWARMSGQCSGRFAGFSMDGHPIDTQRLPLLDALDPRPGTSFHVHRSRSINGHSLTGLWDALRRGCFGSFPSQSLGFTPGLPTLRPTGCWIFCRRHSSSLFPLPYHRSGLRPPFPAGLSVSRLSALECLNSLADARLLCPLLTSAARSGVLLLPQSRFRDIQQISRDKTRPPSTRNRRIYNQPLDGYGLRYPRQLVRRRMPHIRFLSIGSRLCSTLPSDPASRRRPCASLSLLLHQDVKGTCTPKLSIMHGVQGKLAEDSTRFSAAAEGRLLKERNSPQHFASCWRREKKTRVFWGIPIRFYGGRSLHTRSHGEGLRDSSKPV